MYEHCHQLYVDIQETQKKTVAKEILKYLVVLKSNQGNFRCITKKIKLSNWLVICIIWFYAVMP